MGWIKTYYPAAPILLVMHHPCAAVRSAWRVEVWLTAIQIQFRDVRSAVPLLVWAWVFATPIAHLCGSLGKP
jgi:ABC-type polysaccharide/polyol phosphate export permease